MDMTPYNEYMLVLPNGDCKGFEDSETLKAYINLYYENKVKEGIHEDDYNDGTELSGDEPRQNICTQLGVDEGLCHAYRIEDFINEINNTFVFDNEKEEVISKLIEEDIELNVNDYNLDLVLIDTKEVDIMETYGSNM